MKKYLEIYQKTWKYHGILWVRKSGNPGIRRKDKVLPKMIAAYIYIGMSNVKGKLDDIKNLL